jgi:hypothetical protein
VEVLSLRRLSSLLLGLCLAAAAHAQQATEAALKAAFLYKFAGYVEWQKPHEGPFVFGVMGADEVADELEAIVTGRQINNRPIAVKRLKPGEVTPDLRVLYVGRREAPQLAAVTRAARPLSVLVVSDAERGLEAGSVINLLKTEDRIGFEVSVDAAERSGLAVSSRMLAVARRVVPRSPS